MNLKPTISRLVHIGSLVEPEAVIWVSGLVILAFINPDSPDSASHFSICPFHALGITWCPGCGLGRSVSFLLHAQIRQSLLTHPLGIIALPILLHRIFVLVHTRFSFSKPRFRH